MTQWEVYLLNLPSKIWKSLKDLLIQRKENHANHIVVSTNKNRDLFDGDVSELPEVLLNARIFVWDKKDGIYITI